MISGCSKRYRITAFASWIRFLVREWLRDGRFEWEIVNRPDFCQFYFGNNSHDTRVSREPGWCRVSKIRQFVLKRCCQWIFISSMHTEKTQSRYLKSRHFSRMFSMYQSIYLPPNLHKWIIQTHIMWYQCVSSMSCSCLFTAGGLFWHQISRY